MITTTRHALLADLHARLAPKTYLEIGVQRGHSLALAGAADVAIGIDPEPLIQPTGNQVIHRMTSDEFFGHHLSTGLAIDLAFIDGMHLVENALRDFVGIETRSHPRTVVVFDDVLPRSQAVGARAQCAGDWAGDVWKIMRIFAQYRPDLSLALVDVEPTGALIVSDLNAANFALKNSYDEIVTAWAADMDVPPDVLLRSDALAPHDALELVMES